MASLVKWILTPSLPSKSGVMGAGQGGDEGLEQPGGDDGLHGLLLVGGVQPHSESATRGQQSSQIQQASRAIHRSGA
jgi:hypothetical protein